MPFGQQLTIPSELTLHSTEGGYQLRMNPIEEFESLRLESRELRDVMLSEEFKPLSEIEGELLEVEVEFEPFAGAIIVFNIRGVKVAYNSDTQELSCGPVKSTVPPVEGTLKLRIIQDRTSVEIYGNNGMVYAPFYVDVDEENLGVSARSFGAAVVVKALRVHRLKSIWD